jgi:hypothetical protein
MWIVAIDKDYYPSIQHFQDENMAQKYYNECLKYEDEYEKGENTVYLAEVKSVKFPK